MGKNKDALGKLSVHKTGNGYRVDIDWGDLGEMLDIAQLALDTQVWNDVQKYMPFDTGALISDTSALNAQHLGTGKVYMYPPNSDYGHYLYEGFVYVDPKYEVGAFYDPAYGFWSRPGVKKIKSNRKLDFQRAQATDHWGETAIGNHADDWVEVVRRVLGK